MAREITGWGAVNLTGDPETWPPAIVRTYQGKPAQVAEDAAREAVELTAKGYVEVNRLYTPGSWSGCAFLIALALILAIGLGLLIIAYMVIVKPPGTLTVTYARQAPRPPESPTFQRFG